jgi:hypothetical protein
LFGYRQRMNDKLIPLIEVRDGLSPDSAVRGLLTEIIDAGGRIDLANTVSGMVGLLVNFERRIIDLELRAYGG